MTRPADIDDDWAREIAEMLVRRVGPETAIKLIRAATGPREPAPTVPVKPTAADHEEASRAMRRVLSRRGGRR